MSNEFKPGVTVKNAPSPENGAVSNAEEREFSEKETANQMRQHEEDFIQEVDEREYIVEGSINLDELNDRLELDLNSDEYDSLGGFIIERLDRLPEAGDSICTDEGIHMVVERLDKNRIELVHLYLPEPTPEKGEDSDD